MRDLVSSRIGLPPLRLLISPIRAARTSIERRPALAAYFALHLEGAMKSVRRACLLAAVVALIPLSAQAQSFSCRYASRPDEVTICQNSGLAALDERMAGIYERTRSRLYGAAREGLVRDQSIWLRSRYSCGPDAACIEDAYRQRINELRNY
jgi:uncharacterized protein